MVPRLSAPVRDTTKSHRRRGYIVAAVVLGLVALLAVAVDNLVLSGPLSATGVVQPVSSAQLNMATTGPITSILVKVGDVVQPGQVLATQDISALQAKTAADKAQQVADWSTLLAEQQGGSNTQLPTLNGRVAAPPPATNVAAAPATPQQIATILAAVQRDQAAIASDAVAETQAVVKAPFTGVVSSINGTVGEIASPNGVRLPTSPSSVSQSNSTGIQLFPQGPQSQSSAQPSSASLISLDSLDSNFVVQVPESGISQVHIGQTAHITLPAFSGLSVPAKVVMIQPTPVSQSGTTYFLVHLQAPSKALQSSKGGTGKPSSNFDRMAGFTVDASF